MAPPVEPQVAVTDDAIQRKIKALVKPAEETKIYRFRELVALGVIYGSPEGQPSYRDRLVDAGLVPARVSEVTRILGDLKVAKKFAAGGASYREALRRARKTGDTRTPRMNPDFQRRCRAARQRIVRELTALLALKPPGQAWELDLGIRLLRFTSTASRAE